MSQWLKLVARNALRHRLRTSLTVAGLVVAILTFGVLQTIVDAWYAGVDGAVPSRLITRNAMSFTLPLPITYEKRIRAVDGVRRVSYMNWFGGIYKDPKNFFPQFAIEPASYLDLHPEIRLAELPHLDRPAIIIQFVPLHLQPRLQSQQSRHRRAV